MKTLRSHIAKAPKVRFRFSLHLATFLTELHAAYKTIPLLDYELFTETGERGWIGTWHNHLDNDSLVPIDEPIETRLVDETRIFISTSTPKNITRKWTLRLRGQLKPRPYDIDFEFGLTAAGRAKVISTTLYFTHRSIKLTLALAVCGWTTRDR